MTDTARTEAPNLSREGHGGDLGVAVARAHGIATMFTLSGAHVFPLYDAAVREGSGMALVDVRHEATAVFAAEATAKLTRTPGLAVLTAGPGVTNGISAVTGAWFNGSPLLVLGGRAPDYRWGTGALQELDQPPLLAPITKLAETVHETAAIPARVDAALSIAAAPHRGPVFLDVPMDVLYDRAEATVPAPAQREASAPDPDALAAIADLLVQALHPVLVLGSDVWADGAEHAARRLAETLRLPGDRQRDGPWRAAPRPRAAGHPGPLPRARRRRPGRRGRCPAGLPARLWQLRRRAGRRRASHRSGARRTPGRLPRSDRRPRQPRRVGRRRPHAGARRAAGGVGAPPGSAGADRHLDRLARRTMQAATLAAVERDRVLLGADTDPIHPARIYGELLPRLEPATRW